MFCGSSSGAFKNLHKAVPTMATGNSSFFHRSASWHRFVAEQENGANPIEAEQNTQRKLNWIRIEKCTEIRQNILKSLKILLPHVGLNVLLFSYIAFGAIVFVLLEADTELERRRTKLAQIRQIYAAIVNRTVAHFEQEDPAPANKTNVERMLFPLLSLLSRTHEYDDRFTQEAQMWSDAENQLSTKWTFAASSLYALTVITSTGYDHLAPNTDAGRLFTVFYGLLGIPLMFITAADIGKFLSEFLIKMYAKLLVLCARLAKWENAVMKRHFLTSMDDTESIEWRQTRERRKRRQGTVNQPELDGRDQRPQLPVFSYFALVVGYCAIGSVLFNCWERGAIWSFVHGFFFSFNTITTISLGNIRVTSRAYLALVILYVIIGLSVITASLDLCSSTLKSTFTKLHYFGRKIRQIQGIHGMSRDMRETLKKFRGSKERLTLDDLRRFLEVQERLLQQPFVPQNVDLFKWIEEAYAQYCADEELAQMRCEEK